MKVFVSVIITTLLLASLMIFEKIYIKNEFNDFTDTMQVAVDKLKLETLTYDDSKFIQQKWQNKKKLLYIFASHNDIKEVDLWVNELVSYTYQKNYKEALSKGMVILDLLNKLPSLYYFKIENIL